MLIRLSLLLPFLIQGLLTGIDEYFFHLKRGLPRWERVGHPLDTLSVLVVILFSIVIAPSSDRIPFFIGLSVFSCFFVTKDEFVHHRYCSAKEQWLHSLLFIVHPLCFLAAGWMWWDETFQVVLKFQAILLGMFLFYQVLYWNFLWKLKKCLP